MNEFYENEVGSNRNVWTKKQQQVVIDYLTNVEEGLTKKNTHYFYEPKYELPAIGNVKRIIFKRKTVKIYLLNYTC